MRTAKAKHRRSPKPKQPRQLDLFDEPKVNTKPLARWKQPKIDRDKDPTWWAAFIDPAQVGYEVEIPDWMQRKGA